MALRFTHVVDASALIAYFKGEEGHETFAAILNDERNALAIHVVNLLEVYSDYLRSDGFEIAEEAWKRATSILAVLDKADENFLKRVARWKVEHGLAFGDAFAAAAAEEHGCRLVTAANKEFGAIEQSGAIEIVWIR